MIILWPRWFVVVIEDNLTVDPMLVGLNDHVLFMSRRNFTYLDQSRVVLVHFVATMAKCTHIRQNPSIIT